MFYVLVVLRYRIEMTQIGMALNVFSPNHFLRNLAQILLRLPVESADYFCILYFNMALAVHIRFYEVLVGIHSF